MNVLPKPNPMRRFLRRLLAWPWELFLLLTVFTWLYCQTMPPGMSSWIIEGWDSAMFQITGSTWGMPHSPAYPLYTILANLFVRWLGVLPSLAKSSIVWRVTFWSTVTSLLTLLFVYFTVWQITRHRPAAMASATILGISFIFWRGAIMAEVYSLNALIFALTYWLALTWSAHQRDRYLVALGLTIGAGVVHHRTAFILPPTIAWWVLWHTWKNSRPVFGILGRLFILISLACLPLLSYLYLPWVVQHRSGQTWLYAKTMDWNTFWFIVVTREWWGLVHIPTTPLAWLESLNGLFRQQANQITVGGIFIGLLGLLMAYRNLWLFAPPLLALIFFGTAYKVADLDSMLIPLTLTLSVGVGIFIGMLNRWLVRLAVVIISFIETTLEQKWISTATQLLLMSGLVAGSYLVFRPLFESNYQAVNLSGDWQAEDLVEETVAIAKAGTPLTIIGQDNSVLPDFIYAKVLLAQEKQNGLEPLSTTTLSRMSTADSYALLYNRFIQQRRILVDKETIDLAFIQWLSTAVKTGQIFLAPTGHPYLWELLPRPLSHQTPSQEALTELPSGQFLDGQMSIIATGQQIIQKRTGCFLRLTLFWQARTALTKNYYVSVQPLGGETVLEKNDHLALMRGYLPTSQLQPDEVVRDEIDLLIRQPAALSLVSLVVNLYQVQGNQFPTFGQVTLPITVDSAKCR